LHLVQTENAQLSSTPSPRVKVALVAPSLRILGGQAVQADRLLRAWKQDPEIEARLVPVNPVPSPPLRFALHVKYLRTLVTEVFYLPKLARALMAADVAHVFSASYSSFLLAPLPAILLARALGKPVVLNYRSGEAPDHLRRSAVARWALRHVQRNVVPSVFLADVFAQFGIQSTVIPNVVDLDSFAFRVRDPLRPRLVSTRNFEALYNVACTIRAFRIVQDEYPEAALTLVGGGAQESQLRALARKLRLEHVTFVGRVPPDEIARYYSDNDIYVQSPDIDNMPTSVLEAYASGLPVVSTEAGGIPAILRSGEHGLLAPLGDHVTLAAHVLRLLREPALTRRLVDAARSISESCTWAHVRDAWTREYRSVLSPMASRDAAVGPAGHRVA